MTESFYTPAEDQAILDGRQAGITYNALAQQLGRPIGSVKSRYTRLRHYQEAQRTPRAIPAHRQGPFTPEEDRLLITAYQNGARLIDIARPLNRTRASVDDRLKRLAETGRVRRRSYQMPDIEVSSDDLAWMNHWKRPRAQRLRHDAMTP